jgi:hypothetical protein
MCLRTSSLRKSGCWSDLQAGGWRFIGRLAKIASRVKIIRDELRDDRPHLGALRPSLPLSDGRLNAEKNGSGRPGKFLAKNRRNSGCNSGAG